MMTTIISVLLLFVAGCTWTPRVETVLHDSPQGFVSLRTIADSTLRADHPVDLSPELIGKVLHGVMLQEEHRLLQRLLSPSPAPRPILSQEHIAFLTPLIADALSKATPEEEVVFTLRSIENGSPAVEGTFLVYNTKIILRWRVPTAPAKLPKAYQSVSSGPMNVQSHTIQFLPKEAVFRGEVQPASDYLSEVGYDALIIDYEVLALLPPLEDRPSGRNRQTAEDDSSEGEHRALPGQAKDTKVEADERLGNQINADFSDERDIAVEELKMQIEALKQELAEQRAVLEKLKNTPGR